MSCHAIQFDINLNYNIDLNEVSEKTGIFVRACRRQFDNIKKVIKARYFFSAFLQSISIQFTSSIYKSLFCEEKETLEKCSRQFIFINSCPVHVIQNLKSKKEYGYKLFFFPILIGSLSLAI